MPPLASLASCALVATQLGCARGRDAGRREPSPGPEPPARLGVAPAASEPATRDGAVPSTARCDDDVAGCFREADVAGAPCGELDCRAYRDARAAFARVLALDPRVLGVGETHAPRHAAVRSAAARFTEELLPMLAGRASDLLLELMQPPPACTEAALQARAAERPVTSRQAVTAQSEYVAMGGRARALGIVPDLLRPTCADLAAIAAAGAGADRLVDTTLSAIARLAAAQALRSVQRDDGNDADRG